MQPSDYQDFAALVSDVSAFYRQDVSPFSLSVWWSALRPYDLSAVREAFSKHAINPDSGQFMPKPADVVKMLGGTSTDSALVAWSKVDRALRHVGTYRSVVFDDPLIHGVLHEMGGWTPLANKTEAEWPFVAKEFQTRYRGYAMRSERPPFPAVLIGLSEAQNSQLGQEIEPPLLLGDAQKARSVLSAGQQCVALTVTPSPARGPSVALSAPLRSITETIANG